ncbi:MAG: cadherin-like beta sandwich domain-containing protein [Nitrospira sp.]
MNACVRGVRAQVRLLALSVVVLVLTGCSARDSLPSLNPAMLPTLSGLTLSAGTLNPGFAAHVTRYTTMAIDTASITVTPTAGPGTTITVNGIPVVSGTASNAITLPTGHRAITVAVTSSSGTATYTITAHRLAQETYIKASNTGLADIFGFSVALDGDTLAVGAWGESSNGKGVNSGAEADNTASAAGAVYVFTHHRGTWQQQAYIKASNTEADDHFGFSVGLDGDILAVGAPFEDSNGRGVNTSTEADNSAHDAGAVYVFARHHGTWHQQAYIKASNTDSEDNFGFSVALDGNTLAVAAPPESSNGRGINSNAEADNSAFGSGAVYVFTRHHGTWQQQAYIKASNAERLDEFGASLALDGDTLAVGAIGESSSGGGINSNAEADNSASNAGAVYVFTRHHGTWQQQAYIKAFNPGSFDFFGRSVALDNDTLAVGASGESSNGRGVNSGADANNDAFQSGAAYVFTRHGGTWQQQAYIKASDTQEFDNFGGSIALSGHTLAVGAIQFITGKTGAVYLFTRIGGAWYDQTFVTGSNSEPEDQFGTSVALSGATLAVGAVAEDSNGRGINSGAGADNSAANAGAVYVGCVVPVHSQHHPTNVHPGEEGCRR